MNRDNKVLIIAEAGVNHNGDINIAYKMIDAARDAGVDVIKFQTANPELVISRYAQKAEYQKEATGNDESQLEMIKRLHFKFNEYFSILDYCKKAGITFLSSPFDIDSIHFLNDLQEIWKIPSGEITNLPYLLEIAKTGKSVIMSTGMCEMDEIETAIRVLRENGTKEIKLLHCNTEYPTPFDDVNLKAMQTMRDAFGLEVGYSDHTKGIEVPIAAVAMGATIIEKHFTLSCDMEGPDHKASLEPDQLTEMVRKIRNIERALGSGKKTPSESEKKNISVARKSIVAKKAIKSGEMFTEENIAVKRPGTGVSPMRWFEVCGMAAIRDFKKDELIEL